MTRRWNSNEKKPVVKYWRFYYILKITSKCVKEILDMKILLFKYGEYLSTLSSTQ